MPEERIQKILARAGVASRRACEDLIRQGRVTVNGERAELGRKADPATDTLRVDGEVIKLEDVARVYIALHKPKGVISAAEAQAQEDRPTVLDLVPVETRLYPVGRLDADSTGLILLTNDGDLTQRLTHPRYGHRKIYRVLVIGQPTPEQLEKWAAGVELDDGMTAPAEVHARKRLDTATWLEVKMGEGRKRQIRRTASALGLKVLRLVRTQIGPLKLGDLKPGEWRYLEEDELRALRQATRPKPKRGGKKRGGQQRRRKPPQSKDSSKRSKKRP